ncbi:hypothetical protein J2R98_001981 [Alkalibacillus filiformis]|uniref:Permease n=1 Tax=Alkalibacillus filiformis TaxID=200990 RepID=A0ABU0DUK8_9BACI|nr:hypothetical protein [Alkalibacillus filiformis]MDQ0352147.1 hypothetical protein [Alkalibacillus filiformis]
MRQVHCQNCDQLIESKKDLFTTQIFFMVQAYCKKCYFDKIKKVSSLAVSNTPLNGRYSNFLAGLTLVGLILVYFAEIQYIKYPLILVLALVLFMRVYSFVRFERHLPF